jgi:hypothetical protein
MRRIAGPYWIKHSHLFDPDEYECSCCGGNIQKEIPSLPELWNNPEELSWILDDD